ncbi:MAG: DUF1996 domain-containing protein [Gaiellaceae bacterium]
MRLLFLLVGSAILTVGVSVALAATSATYPPPSTETANGLFIVNCPFSHRKQVDPIVNPGTPSGHMHDFLGNRSIDSNSTYASASVAATTCAFSGDRAGYWVPTLVAPNGSFVTPRRALVYYRNKPVKYGTTIAFPPDFRLIAGGVGVGPPHAGWSCEQDAANMVATPPNCGSGIMVLHVKFPNCWNGVSTDSVNHRSHVVYPTSSSTCPSTHPVKVPEIFLHVRYQPGASGSGYKLSDGTVSPHADFWNTWQQPKLELLVKDCLRAGKSCGQVSG